MKCEDTAIRECSKSDHLHRVELTCVVSEKHSKNSSRKGGADPPPFQLLEGDQAVV